MKKRKKRPGFTLIELLISLLLFSIVGLILMQYLLTGSTLYKKVYTTYNASSEARIGLSYITVKIRESDIRNGIDIVDNKLIFKDEAGDEVNLIYFENGKLLEQKTGASAKTVAEVANFIPEFEEFSMNKNGLETKKKRIVLKIEYIDAENKTITLEDKISTKSN